MNNKFVLRVVGFIFVIMQIIVLLSVVAYAEDVPFFCGSTIATARSLGKDQMLNDYFDEQDFLYRTDIEAIDYYTSTERTVCIFDDGNEALFTSESGYYLGTITNNTTAELYAFLQTENGIKNSEYGYMSVSTYKNGNGYWVLGSLHDYSYGLLYIDLTTSKCYYKPLDGLHIKLSTTDRYLMIFDNVRFIVIDRDNCEAQIFDLKDIDIVPYFDEDGIATLINNTKYRGSDKDYASDFYKYNEYYYYSWQLGSICPISVNGYDYVCYADKESVIVEGEFEFNKIQNGEIVWQIAKKDILFKDMNMFSIQNGILWQYGNSSKYYHTYLVPKEQALLGYAFNEPTKRIDLANTVGWSGRYSDCYNYDIIDHSLDHYSVFDQIDMRVIVLNKYHRSHRIYNQTHVLWDNCLKKELGGDYGVYSFKDDSYIQRSIVAEISMSPDQETEPASEDLSPTDYFDGLTVAAQSTHYNEMDARNDNYDNVWETIWIYTPARDEPMTLESVTWTHEVVDFNDGGTSEVKGTSFPHKTVTTFSSGVSYNIDGIYSNAWIGLPDQPNLAGNQTIVLSAGGWRAIINVNLEYLGNYETGEGWEISFLNCRSERIK